MKRLHGIVVATVTPMGRTGAVDLGALKALVDFLVQAGVHGLFLLASQGEFFSLDREERGRVARAGVRATRGRVPVVVNTGTVSTAATLALSREAEDEGVDALGLITPFYLKPTPGELFEHYRAILKGVRCPVYGYNNPGRAGGVALDVTTVTRLADGYPRFAGIFDGTGDLQAARRYAKLQGGRFAYFLAGQLDRRPCRWGQRAQCWPQPMRRPGNSRTCTRRRVGGTLGRRSGCESASSRCTSCSAQAYSPAP